MKSHLYFHKLKEYMTAGMARQGKTVGYRDLRRKQFILIYKILITKIKKK